MRQRAHRFRDLFGPDGFALLAVEVDRLHRQQVDHAGEVGLEPDRQLHGHGVVAELLLELVHHPERVGAGAVALVHEGNARHLVAPHLLVDGDGLRLHAADGAQHQDGAVEHPQGALDLDGEVDVAGGVDDVDLVAVPLAERGGRGDGDAPFALEFHAVHERAHAVFALDVVHRVDAVGVEEDPLGEGRLARVDVGADADVPDFADVFLHVHLPFA